MKLVEVDDSTLLSHTNNTIDDESYSKPRVLSTLDNVMNEILRAQIPDADKWKLYSQALQRYLNHAKVNSTKNAPIIGNTNPEDNPFNFSLGSFSERFQNDVNMSGVQPLRDSLDSISQPSVRNFFEQARDHNFVVTEILPEEVEAVSRNPSPPQRQPKHTKNHRRVLPYRLNMAPGTRKRRAENNLSANMSQIRPCKVSIQNIDWVPTTAR